MPALKFVKDTLFNPHSPACFWKHPLMAGKVVGGALDNMLLGMARQSHGPVELIADDLEGIIDAYSADCIISYGNIACKHKNGVPKIFKDICNKSGLPSLLMKTDLFDKRINSEEEIKQQISDFFIDSGLVT